MSRPLPKLRRYIDPQDFRDLRIHSRLTRRQAADVLDVTPRTIQNWETGGARIPWLAYRMLRILRGYALPGQQWEGWRIVDGFLVNPEGRFMDVCYLENFEMVFAQARLWRQMYAASGRAKTASTVLPFPDLKETGTDAGGRGAPAKALPFPERRQMPAEKTIPVTVTKRAGGKR